MTGPLQHIRLRIMLNLGDQISVSILFSFAFWFSLVVRSVSRLCPRREGLHGCLTGFRFFAQFLVLTQHGKMLWMQPGHQDSSSPKLVGVDCSGWLYW